MNHEITKEMVYLCIGDDIQYLDYENIYYDVFKGVKYYIVENEKVLKEEEQLFCSCNENYCWHIFKVILNNKIAKSID